jgi:hypothetical protein
MNENPEPTAPRRDAAVEDVELARSRGIDLVNGENVDRGLQGVATIVEVTNTPTLDADPARGDRANRPDDVRAPAGVDRR